MERRKEQSVSDALLQFLRESGLETPLLQLRLIQAWPEVVGEMIAQHTFAANIREQVLLVETDSASLCQDLQMKRSQLVRCLNDKVGSHIIADIRFTPTLVR